MARVRLTDGEYATGNYTRKSDGALVEARRLDWPKMIHVEGPDGNIAYQAEAGDWHVVEPEGERLLKDQAFRAEYDPAP